jgi:hypothetical protein
MPMRTKAAPPRGALARPRSLGREYANVQFETDAAASESTFSPTTFAGCAVPAPGSPGAFYPYVT